MEADMAKSTSSEDLEPLKARVEANPGDQEAVSLLIQGYTNHGQFKDAVRLFEDCNERGLIETITDRGFRTRILSNAARSYRELRLSEREIPLRADLCNM